MKKWAFDPKNSKNHVFGVKHPYFHLKPVLTSGMMTNQFWDLIREKKQGCSTKKWLFDPQNTLKTHFSPESLQNRFTFGHILSREVTWSIKNHMLKMVIDPWPGGRSGGQWWRPSDNYHGRLQQYMVAYFVQLLGANPTPIHSALMKVLKISTIYMYQIQSFAVLLSCT